MKAVVQLVRDASISVGEKVTGSVHAGLLVYVGVEKGDSQTDADYLVRKITEMRIFPDGDGKMNLSVGDVNGSILAVSQFTLLADVRKGRRPGYDKAELPDKALPLFNYFVDATRSKGFTVETGVFGAHMMVQYTNVGPVTMLLDSHTG
jgi:D-tyrosyl-tRNA(Tyr) deacylase